MPFSSSNIDACREQWTRTLREIASESLDLCPDFPAVTERWEAWWRFEADRPLLCATVHGEGFPGGGKCYDLLADFDRWLAKRRSQVEHITWYDAAIPNLRVELGPVAMAAFIGCPLHLAPEEDTTWQEPILADWNDQTAFELDPDNPWVRLAIDLTRVIAKDAAGRYVVTLPDLTGSIDTLANMRGPENLLLDLYDYPERVKAAVDRLVDAWETVFSSLYDTVLSAGAGTMQWLLAWSNTPYTLPTCDFSFSIGSEQFKEFCLPSLTEQARRAGRCLFHLDGEGASKHAEALAATPEISAVQYTPNANAPSALAKLEMFKMLQEAGKPIMVIAPLEELPALVDELDPRGVAFYCPALHDRAAAEWAMETVGAS